MSLHDPALQETLTIFAVAQQYFETSAETGALHVFSRLRPLVLEDGRRARESDYPNNGLVWWKLRPASRKNAVPGRLFAGYIEPAVVNALNDPTKELYQASSLDLEPLDPGDAVEIFTVPDRAAQTPRDLVNTPGLLHTDHPPSDVVMVRWRGELYGLFRTAIAASGGGEYRVSLAPENVAGTVYRMPDVPADAPGHLRLQGVAVALDAQPPFRSRSVATASYELALPQALQRIDVGARRPVLLLRDEELIARAAKRLLTRTERQQLQDLLQRLVEASDADGEPDGFDVADVLGSVRRRVPADSPAVASLADALISSDIMAAPLAEAVQRHVSRHIEQNAASISAQIEERVVEERRQLARLQREREDVEAELRARREAAEREAAAEIDAAWQEHRASVKADLTRLREEQKRLEEHASSLTERLTRIASTFGSEHERLLGDLLVLLPVLQRTVAERGTRPASAVGYGESDDTSPGRPPKALTEQAALTFPPYVQAGAAGVRRAPTEPEFFERFTEFVAASGYAFGRGDLAAFHVAMKCGDVTLVGGAPGTGRTTLTRLYATALAGDHRLRRWLSVPVQTTWLDLQDFVGSINRHARLFEPAPTGIFGFLVACAEEYALHDGECGVHVLCLSGLDRAAPESYLSAILHVLDQPPDARALRCFDPHAVHPDSALARWSTITLPPSLRIVGTVSGDDSARELPLALRDRANELRLGDRTAAEYTPGGGAPIDEAAVPEGAPVSLRTFDRWVRVAPLSTPWAELFDRLREPLRTRNVDLSPRALRAMYRFITSAAPLLDVADAVDLQVVQRVLPRVAAIALHDEAVLEQVATALTPHADALVLSASTVRQLREERA